MRIDDLSEDELLARIVPTLPRAAQADVPSGDDCAVLRLTGERVAVSTDMLVEGTHFTRDWSTGYDVGWRAAVQSLADSVSMGARPVSLVVAVELPGDMEVEWLEEFARGTASAARRAGAGVDGGDLTGGPAVCVAVTVLGDPEGRRARRRSDARVGEDVVHCGPLGFSSAGYELLASGRRDGSPGGADLVDTFLRPDPPLEAAMAACREGAVGALMDVSDGLVRDARRMARASGVWIDLDSAALEPCVRELTARGLPRDAAIRHVLAGGEDHGFLGTARGGVPAGFRRIGAVRRAVEGGRVTVDGSGVAGAGGGGSLGGGAVTSLLVEQAVPFTRELAVLLARSPSGEVRAWPVAQTVQDGGICSAVIAPAPGLEEAAVAQAQRIGRAIAEGFGVTGVLAVELFAVEEAGRPTALYVNELAMRPHNSGHWTQDGAVTSQFAQHVRAVLDLPLGSPEPTAPATVMVNVLGGRGEPGDGVLGRALALDPQARVHMYGKGRRPGRKLGHVNLTVTGDPAAPADAQAVAAALERARAVAAVLRGDA